MLKTNFKHKFGASRRFKNSETWRSQDKDNMRLIGRFQDIQKGKLLSVSRYGGSRATFGVKNSQLHHQGTVDYKVNKSLNIAKRKSELKEMDI